MEGSSFAMSGDEDGVHFVWRGVVAAHGNGWEVRTSQMLELAGEQESAVLMFKRCMFSIITGGPGVGKTTTLKYMLEAVPNTVILTPTGSAASRVTVACGVEAHVFKRVDYNDDLLDEFRGCSVVLEEASMCSMEIIYKILLVLRPVRFCLMGDKNQLPCIKTKAEPSTEILGTLLAWTSMPRVELVLNHRQKNLESALVRVIRSMGTSEFVLPSRSEDDSFVVHETGTDKGAIAHAAAFFLKQDKAQMLTSTNSVVDNLNLLTKDSPNRIVVCTENLYTEKRKKAKTEEPAPRPKLLTANGIRGFLEKDGSGVTYDNGFVDRMLGSGKFKSRFIAARAMSIHKSQGNEFSDVGIIVVTTNSFGKVDVRMAYTAVTRFTTRVVVFGTGEAIRAAFGGLFEAVIQHDALAIFDTLSAGAEMEAVMLAAEHTHLQKRQKAIESL